MRVFLVLFVLFCLFRSSIFTFQSPQFHLNLYDMLDVHVHNIVVNVTIDPATLWKRRRDIPIFPLNTDGVDVAGRNILVENCWIRNYDDSVCAKTSNGGSMFVSFWGFVALLFVVYLFFDLYPYGSRDRALRICMSAILPLFEELGVALAL